MVPGDENFLSTKYDASQPAPSRDSCEATAPIERRRSRRDSMTRSLFRSLSSSRIPNRFRSASLTRTPTISPTIAQPGLLADETGAGNIVAAAITTADATAVYPTSAVNNERRSRGITCRPEKAVVDSDLEEEVLHNRDGGEPVVKMEEHERRSVEPRLSQVSGQVHRRAHSHNIPPSASRTWRMMDMPMSPSAPLPQQSDKSTAVRSIPQFHRPYSQPQQRAQYLPSRIEAGQRGASFEALPAPDDAMIGSLLNTTTSPTASSSTPSSSCASSQSLTPAAIITSCESLALTIGSAITQPCSTPPRSSRCSESSCVTPTSEASLGSHLLGTPDRRNSTKFDFDVDSSDGEIGDEYCRFIPGVLCLSSTASHESLAAASLVEESSPITKPRRRVKTPVYAIGQLETGISAEEARKSILSQQDELSLLQSKSSIECIAEEYRALLASRNSLLTDSIFEVDLDTLSSPTSSYLGDLRGCSSPERSNTGLQTQTLAGNMQRRFMLIPTGETKATQTHIHHDSSSLPAPSVKDELPRESDHVSGMQSSHSPQLLPLLHTKSCKVNPDRNSTSNNITEAPTSPSMLATPAMPSADKPGLQTCIDLLTRELSAAVLRRSSPTTANSPLERAAFRSNFQHNGSTDINLLQNTEPAMTLPPSSTADGASAALQILVMIEAYEQLQKQLVADAKDATSGIYRRACEYSASKKSDTEEIEAMFGLWLSSLHRIYDSLTGKDAFVGGTIHNGDDSKADGPYLENGSDYVWAVKTVFVNIRDFLEAAARNQPVPRHGSYRELKTYTRKESRFFPRKDIVSGSPLSALLREII
ncbi:hypothetical protein SEPCBS119000_004588 [Sporothrix epigloea]|uniref:Uncharacterized protein n=1 Tax=Sporothrix epigloea TaxID=1892477 RepID=A0ABP0DVU6_9PEZI